MEIKNIIEKLSTNRRGLLKSLLTAGFAAPVISTFSTESLMGQCGLETQAMYWFCLPNTTLPKACLNQSFVPKSALPNVGYSGPVFFSGHLQELGIVQTYVSGASLPMPVSALCPASPSRVTIGVTFQIVNSGPTAEALQYQFQLIPGVTILTAGITINGQQVCSLQPPNGQLIASALTFYSDLNALFEEMAQGHATMEAVVILQGYQATVFGKIEPAEQPVNSVTLTS